MSYLAEENRYYSAGRRCKYIRLTAVETIIKASGSLLMPPDDAKVFG
ncbi:hypothetical protein ACFLT6_00135 [Chloroflexota bacterium]